MIHMKVIAKVATESKHREWTTKTIVRQNIGGMDDSGCRSLLGPFLYNTGAGDNKYNNNHPG